MTIGNGWRLRFLLAICVLLVLPYSSSVSAGFLPPHSPNLSWVVTKTADTLDGTCDSDCSLREAIQAANNAPGVDTITFGLTGTQVYPITIPGTGEVLNQTGDFNILDELILTGNGTLDTVIDGAGLDRVFQIGSSVPVTMTGIKIQGGNVPVIESVGGGGVLVKGVLVLDDVEITSNQAYQGAGISNALGRVIITNSKIWNNGSLSTQEGGGIYSDGDLDISADTKILSNTAIKGAGVSGTESADMRFNRVEISNNIASLAGGAIYGDKQITLMDCTISGNQAQSGAGIYNNYYLYVESTTIDHNVASNDGGGLYNEYQAYLKNVTISANSAGDGGGGIFNIYSLELTQITLAQNSAPTGGTIYNEPSGVIQMVNSIVSRDRLHANCYNAGTLTSLGHNLEDVNTCGLYSTGDKRSQDPKLSALSFGLFKTRTHALASDSPALETGDPLYCLPKDQRGVLRPVDGNEDGNPICDMGAYELFTAGLISFSPASLTKNEGEVATIIVTRSGINIHGYSVSVNYSPITAYLWDFTMTPGVFTWAAADNTPRTFDVTILDDNYKEPDKLIELQLTNPTYGVGVYPDGIAAILVPENDPDGEIPPSPLYLPIVRR